MVDILHLHQYLLLKNNSSSMLIAQVLLKLAGLHLCVRVSLCCLFVGLSVCMLFICIQFTLSRK